MFALLLLFVGNVGVNVFKHICEKDGVTVSYFFNHLEEHCQDHLSDVPICCKKEEKKKEGCGDKDCCDDEVEYIKIDLDYYNTQSEAIQLLPFVISTKDHSVTLNLPEIQYSISNYVHPPPLSGRDILIFKQVLVV